MKKIFSSVLFFVICLNVMMAQIPQAFKYQAVIRDINGIAITDQDINLKVSILFANPDNNPIYSETHLARTNLMGMVNLEIGRGFNPTSDFSAINWADGNYYVRIEMDDKGGNDFKSIGVAQLLSVPYALHAGTALSIAHLTGENPVEGVPSNNWSLFGNSSSGPPIDKLGTTDHNDLMMVTNDLERMRIKADGDIDIVNSLRIGNNLTVEENVFLNTIGGSTTNNGPFTVAQLSPTLLSGTLTVDKETDLNLSLNVDGITNLNAEFNVNNGSPSVLTGTLLVNDDATFNKHITLDNASLGSSSPSTGALVVAGGTGIGENLYVGGSAFFDGPLSVTDDTESTSTTTGALIVTGGVGIGKRLNVGGAALINNTLGVNGQVTINANPGSGNQSTYNDYPLKIEGGQQGLAIKVNGTRSTANNYVSFWDGGGSMWGRIEGQTSGEVWSDSENALELALKTTDIALFIADEAIGLAETAQGVIKLTAAGTSSTACVGLGACITAPIPSLIIESSTNLVLKIANAVVLTANLALKVTDLATFVDFKNKQAGVTYQSGSGDYAEWLPKEDPGTFYTPGELVGIRNGFVTRNLTGADKIMVVSTNPIVLGNMPIDGQENNYVKIAFMGQVPVKVLGTVKPGDYILPSELGNGFGKAVNPDQMELKDYKNIAGVAWSDIVNMVPGASLVNVAVGINANDMTRVMYKQEEKYNALRTEYNELKAKVEKSNSVLSQLVPGYAEATGNIVPSNNTADPYTKNPQETGKVTTEGNIAYSSAEDIVYFEISREQVEASLDLARESYKQTVENQQQLKSLLMGNTELKVNAEGTVIMPIEDHPFWKRIDSDPAYREEILQYVESSLEKSLYTQRKYVDKFTDMKIKE